MSGIKPYSEGYGTLTYDPTNGLGDTDSKWMSTINTSRTDRTKQVTYSPQGSYTGLNPKTLSIALKKSDLILKLDKIETTGMTYDSDYTVNAVELDIPNAYNEVPVQAYYLVKLRTRASNNNGFIYLFLNGNVIDVSIDNTYSLNNAVLIFDKGIYITTDYALPNVPSLNSWIPGTYIEQYPQLSTLRVTSTYHPLKASLAQSYSFRYDVIDDTHGIVISNPYEGENPFPLLTDFGDIGEKKQMIYMAIPFGVLNIENDATKRSMLTIRTAVIKDNITQDDDDYIADLDTDFKPRTLNIVFVVDDSVANLDISPNNLTFDANATSNGNYVPIVQVDSNIPWEIR